MCSRNPAAAATLVRGDKSCRSADVFAVAVCVMGPSIHWVFTLNWRGPTTSTLDCVYGWLHAHNPSTTNPKAIKTSRAVLGRRDLRSATITTSSEFYQPFHAHCVLQPSRATDVPYELRGSRFLVCRRMWNCFPQRLLLGADLLGVVQWA